MEKLERILAGMVGGFVGGALIGLAEGLVISITGGGPEYGVFRFAVLAYGLFGAAMGAGWGFAATILPFLAAGAESAMGTAAGLSAAALGIVVFRFRIIRDVFGESLPMASASGIVVHVGLLVGAAAIFWFLRSRLVRSAEHLSTPVTGIGWAAGMVGTGFLLSGLLNVTIGGESEPDLAPATAKGPNVLLIIADTLRPDYIGPYGSKDTATPALDELASEAVVFEKGFATASWTRPSVASILTSLYPASHSVMHKTDLLPDDAVTLAEAMQEAGYRTSGFVTNINVAPSFNFQQGFEKYRYLSPDFFFGATDSGSKLALYGGMRLIRERFLSSKKYVNNYYQDAEVVNAGALPWLSENSDEPWFTLMHYMDPHDPYLEIPYNGVAVARVDTPHPDPSQTGRLQDLYSDNIEYLDKFLANVFTQLKAAGEWDNTVIGFVADHGEEFYEHEGWWHGTTLYDEQIHVPFIVKLPQGREGGTRRDDFATTLDMAPTLLAGADVEVPGVFQGRDLFAGGQAPAAVYAWEDHEGNVLETVRTDRWKLILANEGNPRGLEAVELYDLAKDPGETNNLAEARPDKVAALTGDLEVLREVAGAGAVEGSTGELDEAAKERLRALGYME